MNKQIMYSAALSLAILTSCGGESKKQAGEEFYDSAYRAKADSAYDATVSSSATNQAQTNGPADNNTEMVSPNASTHSAASEAPAAEADKSQASSPAKVAGTAPTEQAPAADKPAATKSTEAAKPAATPVAAAGNFEKGKTLISKSDCLACHKVDQKLVGPAYNDVAKKYEANEKTIAYLANKIIKGGAGAWGEIPMSPHPTLSPADSREMAKYILSLR
jgi:cytochrome c